MKGWNDNSSHVLSWVNVKAKLLDYIWLSGIKVRFQLYLADNVGGQVKQAKGVSFVPRVQHTKEMGDVISTVPCVREVKTLLEQKQQLKQYSRILM